MRGRGWARGLAAVAAAAATALVLTFLGGFDTLWRGEHVLPDGVGDGGGDEPAGGTLGDLALDDLGVRPEVLEHVVIAGEGLGAAGKQALEGLLAGVFSHVPLQVFLALKGGGAAGDGAVVGQEAGGDKVFTSACCATC